jgi:ABC-type transporter Mla maintaining outer membrane lipid asymmetry ATPase subunit MlaF
VNSNGRSLIARIDGVTLSFGDRIVLKNCNLDVVEGAITCIIGLSGAGKSTILRLLDGLLLPNEGHIYVLGSDLLVSVRRPARQPQRGR